MLLLLTTFIALHRVIGLFHSLYITASACLPVLLELPLGQETRITIVTFQFGKRAAVIYQGVILYTCPVAELFPAKVIFVAVVRVHMTPERLQFYRFQAQITKYHGVDAILVYRSIVIRKILLR